MEQNDVLDSQQPAKSGKAPTIITVLAIFSFIGSGIWAILLLWGIANFESFISTVPAEAFAFGGGDVVNMIRIILIALLLINIGTIVGPAMMLKMKKRGFIIYVVCNGLWAILFIISGDVNSIILGLISVAFIFGYASKLKEMS